MSTVTCHTDGCGNNGEHLEMDLEFRDEDGNVIGTIDTVYCGVCGQLITDIVEIEHNG